MPLVENFRYRKDIDGLRAVAILAVVFFHAGFGCQGGFVGVDIFFVISGYLIPSLIWRDLEQGRFSFAEFWERRARRIVPALIVVTLAVLAAGWFLLLPTDYLSLGKAAASQALFAANFHYWLTSGYFDGDATERPLLHTWSLAVEEQFYFIAPFLLWILFRFRLARGRPVLLSLLGCGLLFSLGLSIIGMTRDRDAAFYLVPSRAWEFLCGSLVAFLPNISSRLRLFRETLGLAGLAGVLYPIFAYSSATYFPGLAALPICVGTALIIWANSGNDPNYVGRVLSTGPLVAIGLISYSLYLWHWPFLAFDHYMQIDPQGKHSRVPAVALGFLFAIISWRYVETPFRKRQLGASRRAIFAYTGAGLAFAFFWGALCVVLAGFPARFAPRAQAIANIKVDSAFFTELTAEDIQAGHLISIGSNNSSQPATVLVWGDSHAMAALPAFDEFLKDKGLRGVAATRSATAPVLDWVRDASPRSEKSVAFNRSVMHYVESHRLSEVIFVARWPNYAKSNPHEPGPAFTSALLATIHAVRATGARVWIIMDVPAQPFDVPQVLSRHLYPQADLDLLCTKVAATDQYDYLDPQSLAQLKAGGVGILDPKPLFINSTGVSYAVEEIGTVLYRDNDHLSPQGARLKLGPFFKKFLQLSGSGIQQTSGQ